ncbi:MAG: urease accessory protein UreF [Roseinatronobacter sp.]|jgi:urease accessory protein|nr:urease accessory protein UreF [Roseinatronobacter sp.]
MTETTLSLIRLLHVSDSAFPSGAFAFSSGLETLVNEGRITDAASIHDVLTGQILPRWASFDRPFLHAAHMAAGDIARLKEIDARCHLQNSADRLAEAARRIGRSILSVHARIATPGAAEYRAAIDTPQMRDMAGHEPVVQGLVGAGLGLSLAQTELSALHSTTLAFISAAVRLGRLGAIEAQGVLSSAATQMAEILDAPAPKRAGAFSPFAEIAALRRSTAHASLFAT